MKRLAATVLLAGLASLAAADSSNLYHQLFASLESQVDANAGLTVFPSLLIPSGGRMEGMGTAFTAVADDSGFIEANPAASASLSRSELSVLHNNWISDTRVESVVYTTRFDDLGLGAAAKVLYLPFTHYNGWGERNAASHISESIATLNASYNFLSSYSFFGLSVGANLKAGFRSIPSVFASGQSAFAVMADIGLLTRFNLLKFFNSREPNVSVGTAFKNLGPYVLGEPLPTYWTTGISYAPIRPVMVAFDVTLPFSFDAGGFPAEKWFVAAGVDVAVTNFLSVQAGFRYKPASPRLTLGSSVELDNISLVANYVVDFNSDPRFSVEAKLDLGDSGRAETRARVDELYVRGLDAYARGDSDIAIEFWQQALELDPGFTPARTNVELVANLLRLQESIEGIQIGN